ncbi:flavodoxin family protein [Paenarthrobacter sp. JL.01a]|uniref:flavodoxin family protein n=1 Tax=Paenarthrobacter sp. JL.01a TaxID=2979324 RepID=UPI0021C9B731|nr:flavodoxin domain-containing protein [Paenarthrobacter sp. JL.01a]UXM93502.1 hypothetical protein N5P29_09440 [Paenarthrobacter sp. JL.01a]
MKAVIMYDSAYGNTKSVAEAIAAGLEKSRTVPVSQFHSSDLSIGDLLVVGSPINGWRPTETQPMPFYVKGTEGPLLEGEIKRASSWSYELSASVKAFASRKGTP